MNVLVTALRRSLWLLLIGAVGGAAWSYWRDRTTPDAPGPAEWPPLQPEGSGSATSSPAASAGGDAAGDDAGAAVRGFAALPESGSLPAPEPDSTPTPMPDPVTSAGDSTTWVAPDDAGACPVSHPIKANDNSGIYHVPEGRFYERTKAERCYVDSDAAEADGYRRSKS